MQAKTGWFDVVKRLIHNGLTKTCEKNQKNFKKGVYKSKIV